MKRFFGLMPSASIEISKRFEDKSGKRIQIDAGKEGWTILFADNSTDYEDFNATAEENYKRAYKAATDILGELTPIEIEACSEVYEEECSEC